MKKYKIKIGFVKPMGPKSQASETGNILRIFIFMFMENCPLYDAIHVVWLRNGSNPADIERFPSQTGKY